VWGVKSVSISKENSFHATEESFILSHDRKRAIQYFGSESQIFVKKEIEVISSNCFHIRSPVHAIVFEPGSRLKEIESFAIRDMKIARMEIPANCEVLNGTALAWVKSITISRENPFFMIDGSFIVSRDGKQLIRYLGSETEIIIKKETEVIGEGCFYSCKLITSVSFEARTKLQRIGDYAFSKTGVKSITIPCTVEELGSSCFHWCKSLESVTFERTSRLQRIGSEAFCETNLQVISIPASVQVLDEGCFLFCRSLHEVSFEKGSRLQRIDRVAFSACAIKTITIPSVSIIGAGCFYACPRLKEVKFEGNVPELDVDVFCECPLESITVSHGAKVHPRTSDRFQIRLSDSDISGL
jgi:hypothetical protein